ncbi:hypothetical protein C8R43DRAFT_964489 [Mycena crocata]|nr:hypothetical protein C8R43DRAFT_964489 [Mycena crocata]
MPTPIPQDIIDLIVNEIDDIESLKSCSLVSTRFRGASQRILLSSLTLSRTWNHGKVACTLIIDSPHTAPYIKKLTLHLPSWLPNGPAAARRLREAFNRLTNVRQLTIEGNMVSWKSVSPLASAILDFIRQRELKKLHIRCVKSLPGPVLAALVTSSPVVSLTSVTPPSEPDDLVGGVEAQGDDLPVSKLQQLRVENSEDACGVLATPEFTVCLRALRRLGLKQAPANSSLISAVSAHLEHIYFELPTNSFHASLPPLPRLRTIHLVLDWGSSGRKQCLINTIAAILLSCPAIRDIIFT